MARRIDIEDVPTTGLGHDDGYGLLCDCGAVTFAAVRDEDGWFAELGTTFCACCGERYTWNGDNYEKVKN